MPTFAYGQDAMNVLTDKKTTNFADAVKRAKDERCSFIVKHSINKAGKPVKTIMGWDIYIISYQMGKKIFADNTSLSARLEEIHHQHTSKTENEVYAWSPTDGLLMEMKDINFQRIVI